MFRNPISAALRAAALALALAFAAPAGHADAAGPATPGAGLTVETDAGEYAFNVEIADDPIERARGLMFREEMPADHGMLFEYTDEAPRSFWMKNTVLPLDIIFIGADGKVVSIAQNTTPFSTEPIPSEGPARFVLEVNAGVAERIGLEPGDRIVHPRIEAANRPG